MTAPAAKTRTRPLLSNQQSSTQSTAGPRFLRTQRQGTTRLWCTMPAKASIAKRPLLSSFLSRTGPRATSQPLSWTSIRLETLRSKNRRDLSPVERLGPKGGFLRGLSLTDTHTKMTGAWETWRVPRVGNFGVAHFGSKNLSGPVAFERLIPFP